MIIGEGKKHPSALIVPMAEFVQEWAKRHGIAFSDMKDLTSNEKFVARVQEEVDEFNEAFGNWEKVKKFEILSDQWGVDTNELTPTLKLKRKVIMEKYASLIAKIYDE